ncbi:MAG: hypothetical protein ACRYFB_15750 [Janthinobacterium lividum]
MKKSFKIFVILLLVFTSSYTQSVQTFSQLKTFQQSLSAADLQFTFPKDFREIKALHEENVDVSFAMELPDENFQVWYQVKNTQQLWARYKISEDNLKRATVLPDSLYSVSSLSAVMVLAGKNNFTSKNLAPDVLNTFHASRGKSYQLELYDRPETNHYQYGLLISLQKNGVGYVSMLFLSNDNGPEFYKKVNKAYYSVRFN